MVEILLTRIGTNWIFGLWVILAPLSGAFFALTVTLEQPLLVVFSSIVFTASILAISRHQDRFPVQAMVDEHIAAGGGTGK
jgi:4-hydroxybenzoate polyprenyltransferase